MLENKTKCIVKINKKNIPFKKTVNIPETGQNFSLAIVSEKKEGNDYEYLSVYFHENNFDTIDGLRTIGVKYYGMEWTMRYDEDNNSEGLDVMYDAWKQDYGRGWKLVNINDIKDFEFELIIFWKIDLSDFSHNPQTIPDDLRIGIMRDDKTFSDVKIKTSDGKLIDTHKIILASRSDVFKTMFLSSFKEKDMSEIALEESTEIVNLFLDYMYTNNVKDDVSVDKLLKLFVMADKYAVTGLVKICAHFILKNMNNDNVLNILQTATTLNNSVMQWNALKHISNNMSSVMISPAYANIDRELLHKILCFAHKWCPAIVYEPVVEEKVEEKVDAKEEEKEGNDVDGGDDAKVEETDDAKVEEVDGAKVDEVRDDKEEEIDGAKVEETDGAKVDEVDGAKVEEVDGDS